MTKKELKKLMAEYPDRYKICDYSNGVKQGQFVTVDGGSGKPIVGVIVMVDYPEPKKCIIDTYIEQRIEEGTGIMENSMLMFLGGLLSQVETINFDSCIVSRSGKEGKQSELVKIELPGYSMMFIGDSLGDAIKKMAMFFDNLPAITTELVADGSLRTAAKKILLDTAKA